MFKLVAFVLLFAAIAVAALPAADPNTNTIDSTVHLVPALQTTAIVHEPTLAKVGDIVSSVPTAISHQSSTIVHDRANVVTPIVAPALKTHITPVLSSFESPYVARAYPRSSSVYYPYNYYYSPYSYTYSSLY